MSGIDSPQELYTGEGDDFKKACERLDSGMKIGCAEVDTYIKKCSKALRSLISRFVQDTSSAEDILLEVSIVIYNLLADAQKRRQLLRMPCAQRRAYWKCIAIRQRIDFQRRYFREQNRTTELREELVQADAETEKADDDPEALVERCVNSKNRPLREALRTLKPEQRFDLVLNIAGGWTAQEIADYKKEPVATVRNRISRARKKLGMSERANEGSIRDEGHESI